MAGGVDPRYPERVNTYPCEYGNIDTLIESLCEDSNRMSHVPGTISDILKIVQEHKDDRWFLNKLRGVIDGWADFYHGVIIEKRLDLLLESLCEEVGDFPEEFDFDLDKPLKTT